MKLTAVVLFIITLPFIACKKEGEPIPQDPIKTDRSTLMFYPDKSARDSFTVTYTGSWTIAVNPTTATWLSLSKISGSGNAKVYVTIEEVNTTGTIRNATLIIAPTDATGQSARVEISQEAVKQWRQIAAFPGEGRRNASSFTIGHKFYVGLGHGFKDNIDQDFADMYEYDLTADTWTKKGDFPGGRRSFSNGFTLNGSGYIATGENSVCTISGCNQTLYRDIWQYNDLDDTWQKVATFDELESDRIINTEVFVVGNKAYFLAGEKLWEFDPLSVALVQKADPPYQVAYKIQSAVFTINNKAYVGTGSHNSTDPYATSFYEYDPVTDTWTSRADFTGPTRSEATGFSMNGKGYIACGAGLKQLSPNINQVISLKDVWEYDPSANTWTQVTDYGGNIRHGAVSGVVGNKAIIGSGFAYGEPFDNAYRKDFWIY